MVKVFRKTQNKNRLPKVLIRFSLRHGLISRSLPYQKLPGQLLKLSVLKLDGSSFSFHVARNATVSRLKTAIEEEFKHSQMDEGNFLWSLVWSHFCLCYQIHKLINDKARIQSYGIKDGDEVSFKPQVIEVSKNTTFVCIFDFMLHFVQYLRIDKSPANQQSENQIVESKQSSMSHAYKARTDERLRIEEQYGDLRYFLCEENLAVPVTKPTLAHSLKELLQCSKFPGLKRKELESNTIHP